MKKMRSKKHLMNPTKLQGLINLLPLSMLKKILTRISQAKKESPKKRKRGKTHKRTRSKRILLKNLEISL